MPAGKEKHGYVLRQRRFVGENARFEIFFDDVNDATGNAVSNYLVVAPKITSGDLVTGVAILPIVEGRLGLLRIYRHAIKRHLWEIPRGFIDPGEPERNSARRELVEETGLTCTNADLESLGVIAPEPGILAARVHLFVARRCEPVRPFKADEFGHKEFRWFEPEDYFAMCQNEEVQDSSTLITCLRYLGITKVP
jgi:ADP-ribose pyrophosphatase